MEIFDEDIPLYPFLRLGKRGAEEEEGRHSIIDVRTGEEIAWWTETFCTDVKQNISKKRLKINSDSDVSSTNANDGPFDPTSIFVSGLDVRTSKEEIIYHFSSVGEVTRVTKLKSKLMGKFSGSAYVQYINSQVAENALFLNRSYIRGCSIIVQVKCIGLYKTFLIISYLMSNFHIRESLRRLTKMMAMSSRPMMT